jgi:O-antigen biosynthesis protein
MKVSFIIPLYNCLPLTQAMLASLRETLPPGLECEIIFVDDGSTDGTRAWLQNLPAPCRAILNEKNLGFAGACNRGAAVATGEFLFFLNNDLVLLPRWLEPMLAAFTRFPDTGLVGNVQLHATTEAVDHAGIYFNHQGKPSHRTDLPTMTRWLGWPGYREVDALTGACFGLRRPVGQQLGNFDEGFINGGEDIDLALRAAAAGLRHYVALRSVVRHHISSSVGRNLRNEQNSRRLAGRWHTAIMARMETACSRACLAAAWADPRDYPDTALALVSFLRLAGILTRPTRRLRSAAEAALALEQARWAHLLDGAAAPREREIAWPYFPVARTEPAAI